MSRLITNDGTIEYLSEYYIAYRDERWKSHYDRYLELNRIIKSLENLAYLERLEMMQREEELFPEMGR
jgi:hypothetical protein